MEEMFFCPGCMAKTSPKDGKCPVCGCNVNIQNAPHQLSVNTILNGRYIVGKVLGAGGFGITYIGYDLKLDSKVAIKEYYPSGAANRSMSLTVFPTTAANGNPFEVGKDRFLKEAKTLSGFVGDSNIVALRDYFEENGTAYIVMEYLEGEDLSHYAKKHGSFTLDEALNLLEPAMLALDKVHKKGLIHRDISPSNIMVMSDGRVKVLDFGSARLQNNNGELSLSIMLKPGYAPAEQYSTHGEQGSWTDVYAMSATVYKLITGKTPPPSTDRILDDTIERPSSLGVKITPKQERALMRGLALRAPDRTQTMAELAESLREKKASPPKPAKPPRTDEKEKAVKELEEKKQLKTAKPAVDLKKKAATAKPPKPVKPAEENKKPAQPEKEQPGREKLAKRTKRILSIAISAVIAVIAILLVVTKFVIPNGNYKAAVELMNSGEYERAIAAFEALGEYKDSASKIEECNTAMLDIDYNAALNLMENGKYVDAYEAFIALDDYKDSADKARSIYEQYCQEKLKTAEVGDVVVFGTYEQDNDTSNGKEDIEWQVLAKEDNKILVISKYALDAQPYNEEDEQVTWEQVTWEQVTWENCSLRIWLNGTFLNAAFSAEEEAAIAQTTVTADKNPRNPRYDKDPGNETTDKVFLLSIDEAEKYFSSDDARQCALTDFAVANGAYEGNSGNCLWWLRSPGGGWFDAACVRGGGLVSVSGLNVYYVNIAVRPALWINLES